MRLISSIILLSMAPSLAFADQSTDNFREYVSIAWYRWRHGQQHAMPDTIGNYPGSVQYRDMLISS